MRILYFLSAVMLAVVLIVGCTGEQPGVVDPVQKTGMVPPPAGNVCCPTNHCRNSSECVDNGNGTYSCVCPPGFTGMFCEIDPCGFDPCAEGEICVRGDDGTTYTCATPLAENDDDGDSIANGGDQCPNTPSGSAVNSFGCASSELPPPEDPCAENPCDPNPCQNGGQCADDGSGGYTCTCAPGYTGTNCDIDIDECASNPCVNGDCVDQVNGYQCVCLPGWTGTNCDVPEVTDADGDGVDDNADQCAGTASGDVVDANGCSIAQHCPCDNNWKNHGKYVSCVAHAANDFVDAGLITEAEKGDIVSAAAQSNCGKKK